MASTKLRVALFECERLQEHLAPKVYEWTGGYLNLLQNAFHHFSRRCPISLPSVELIGYHSLAIEAYYSLDNLKLIFPWRSFQHPEEEIRFVRPSSIEEYIYAILIPCKGYAANNKWEDPSWVSGFDTKAEQYPANVEEFAGVLISGSLSGVYDDEPWISRLLQEIKVLDQKKVKTCGISFGHQAIAQALGGTVQKNPKGSEVSVRSATLTEQAQNLFGTDRTDFRLQYHHNDAILKLPEDLQVLASNNVTQYQALFKASHFLTFCGHPDYSHNPEVLKELLKYDREKLWVHEQLIEYGLATLHQPTDYEWVLKQIVRFYAGEFGQAPYMAAPR